MARNGHSEIGGQAVKGVMADDIAAQTKRAVRDALRADRTAPDYFVKAPLVIDCTDDADNFTAAVTHDRRQATIIDRYEQGKLTYVSELFGQSKDYALRKLRERYAVLDRETTSELERLLRDWQTERNRLPTQQRKPPGSLDGGIEIILPLCGIRLKYDLSCLMVV
jgi:hypothetical protein